MLYSTQAEKDDKLPISTGKVVDIVDGNLRLLDGVVASIEEVTKFDTGRRTTSRCSLGTNLPCDMIEEKGGLCLSTQSAEI